MAINITEWPGIWFGIFFKPSKTVARLKSEELGFVEGITSMTLACGLIGLVGFILVLLIGLLGAVGGDGGASLVGGLMGGIIMIIFIIVGCIIALLICTGLLKISSMIFKGKGDISAECGYLGVIGSAALIVMAIFYCVILGVMMLLMVPAMGASMIGGGFGTAMGLMYIVLGIIYIPICVLMYVFLAVTLDLLAHIEGISIYRSGAMMGLMYGLLMLLLFVGMGLFMMLMGSFMPQPYVGDPYGGYQWDQ